MPFTIGELADALGAAAAGDLTLTVERPREPGTAGPTDIALAMEAAFLENLGAGQARAAILAEGADWEGLGLEAAIFAPRSRYVMAGVADVFAHAPRMAPGIHPSAVIEPGAEIGPEPSIGPFVYIQAGARIGARARIGAQCFVGEEAEIGSDALLFPGARIGPFVRIGARFIGHHGISIGADGFSFVTPKPGAVEEARATGRISAVSRSEGFVRINSLGAVCIGDDVEVGANSVIDRGTVADTEVGSGTKIDALVMIGHNVKVGMHCLLCGQSGVAGSSVIGDRVVLAGQAGIADHVRVGDDCIITGQTGINHNVPSGRIMMGSPGVPMDQSVATYRVLRRLPRLAARVDALEKRVSNPQSTE
ncbi:MAG: UDP-3-O-(3-hydroxymyristoyl)glucosamine N-acyltransferase [Pseudomonadota bacterium]